MDLDPSRFNQDEDEKYFFGSSSTEVYDSLKYAITQCITSFLDEYRNALLEDSDSGAIDKELLELQIKNLKDLYLSSCLGVLLDFKVVLQSIFCIPPNAPIYGKETDMDYTEEQVKSLREEVDELEQVYLKEKKFFEILKLEKETIDKLKSIFLETKRTLCNWKGEETRKNEKLRKLFKRHENYINSLVLDTMKIDDSNALQMAFQL